MARKLNWDKIVEVRDGALRMVTGCNKPVVIWKTEDENVARFMWLVMNNDTQCGCISKIYHTGIDGYNSWEFAVTAESKHVLEDSINLMVSSIGLKCTEHGQYPQVYVVNPPDNILGNYFFGGIYANLFPQLVFTLDNVKGLIAITTDGTGEWIEWGLASYDEYMLTSQSEGHNFTEMSNALNGLKEGVAEELWNSMMYN